MLSKTLRLCSLSLFLCGVGLAQQARTPIRLNPGGSNGTSADGMGFAFVDGSFAAVWAEEAGNGNANQDIWCASSSDDGATWSAPTRVDTGDMPHANDSDQPRLVATADGSLVCIWQEFRDAGGTSNADVYFNRSTDGGLTWMASGQPLNTGTVANTTSDIDRIWLAADGDNVHATWEEDSINGLGQPDEIWFTTSSNAGMTWSTPVIITSTTPPVTDADDPKLASSGSNLVVAYIGDGATDEDVHVLNSTNGGGTWSFTSVETNTAEDVDTTRISMDGNVCCVVWFDAEVAGGGEDRLRGVVSTDGGVTWSAEIDLSPTAAATIGAEVADCDVLVQGTDIYVVYTEDSLDVMAGGSGGLSNGKLYCSRSIDSGATWTHDIPIDAADPRPNARPFLTASSSRVYVHVETGGNGNNMLAYSFSDDAGLSWNAPVAVPMAGPDVDTEDDNNGSIMAVNPLTGTAMSCFWDNSQLGTNEVYVSGIEFSIGTNFCVGVANSTGVAATISASGSTSVGANTVRLTASSVPANQFGIFINSLSQGFVPMPGTSQGNLCLGGAIGRYNPNSGYAILNSGAGGSFSLNLDLALTPTPTGNVAIQPGQTWNFQAWHRDLNPSPTNNFTDGIAITF